jgi:hypothetical protein
VEFGFNLAWLILSLALSVGWAWSASRSTALHAHRVSFLALVVLIALLFPVVSISDDLHEDQAKITSEEPRYKDDLQHHLENARLHVAHVILPLDLTLTTVVPTYHVLRLEESRGPNPALMLSSAGFPPALHDLPPPVQA